ncbi:MAG: hypothetical protein GYA33_15145, partial [Thermogutta sp.]|nr:hypothetical protein [Thermogutta sp.]
MQGVNGSLKIDVTEAGRGRFRVTAASGDQTFVDETLLGSEKDRAALAAKLASVFADYDAAAIRDRLDQLAYQACSPAGGSDGVDGDRSRDSQATMLVKLAESLELWHDPKGEAWMTIDVDGHREHWRLR